MPSLLFSVGLSIVLLLPFALKAGAQTATVPQTPANSTAQLQLHQQQIVIRSSTRLVQLSVVVQDKKGHPIRGLKKEDFTVVDQNRPQSIAIFSASDPLAAPIASHPLSSGAFSNSYDLNGQEPGNVTVVLFDLLNTSDADQMSVRKQVLRFLQTLKPQDHVAMYALTRDLLVLHDFTEDSASLVDAVSRLTPEEIAAFDAANPVKINLVRMGASKDWYAFQNRLNNVIAAVADQATLDRARITTAAIEAIADHVAAIPGRKSLIWVSGGFPIQIGAVAIGRPDDVTLEIGGVGGGQAPPVGGGQDPTNNLPLGDRDTESFAPAVSRAVLALNRVNMVMYPIDAHGVEVDARTVVDQRFKTTAQDSAVMTKEQDLRDTSKQLADQTGGLAFFGNNDVTDALRRVMQDYQYAYTIGFYPDHGKWNGKFHEVRINVKIGGARLRYRKGYLAQPYQADSEQTVNASLRQAALSPLEATGLELIAEGKPLEPLSKRSLKLLVRIDPKQLLLQEAQGEQRGAIDLLFAQRELAGNTLAAEKLHLDLKLPQAQYEYLAKAGMVLEHNMTINPQSVAVAVIVRDVGSGAIGSLTIPVRPLFQSEQKDSIPAPATSGANLDNGPSASRAPELKTSVDSATSPLLQQAALSYRNGKLNQAVSQYGAVIRGGSDTALAYAGLARVYLKGGKVAEARASASKSMELGPSLSESHVALGEIYYRDGRLAESEKEFHAALKNNADEALAYFGLSRLYRAGFDEKRWKEAIEKAHTLDPQDPEIDRDWIDTRPADEKLRLLEALVAAGGRGDRIRQAEARQTLAVLKDQAAHPERTCGVANGFDGGEIKLEQWLRPNVSFDARDAALYPGVGVSAALNGHNLRLILASSGSGIILNEEIARKMKMQEIARVDIEGLGDQHPPEGYTGFVESIKIGKVELKNCYLTVAEGAATETSLRDFDGTVGMGMFSEFLVGIDIPHLKLELGKLPPPPSDPSATGDAANLRGLDFHEKFVPAVMKDWTPLYRFRENLVVPVGLNRLEPKLLEISTAANGSMISVDSARQAKLAPTSEEIAASGLNGKVRRVKKTNAADLHFSGLSTSAAFAIVDLTAHSQAFGTELSGVLGFDVLGSLDIKIDFRDGLIRFSR